MTKYLLLLPLLSSIACNNFEGKAKETFSAKFSCPAERTNSKLRADLKSYDLTFGPTPKQEPPAEIQGDPGRLAVWEAQQQEALKSQNSWNTSSPVYEVTGCEHKAFYICAASDQGRAFCRDVQEKYLPAADRSPETPKTLPQ